MDQVLNSDIRRWLWILFVVGAVAGMFVGCDRPRSPSSSESGNSAAATESPAIPAANTDNGSCIDLNSATADDLQRLPGIGVALSARIVEYRARNGPFRRPEDIIIINGISERKFRKMAGMVCVR